MDEPQEIGAKIETAALSEIAASEVMALRKRQESMAQMLAERLNAEALSNLKRKDPSLLTRLHYYYQIYDNLGKMDETGEGFVFPKPDAMIEEQLLILNRSIGAKIIETFRSIAHITEGAPAQRRGIFGRH